MFLLPMKTFPLRTPCANCSRPMLRYAAARLTNPQLPRAFETVGHIAHYNLQEEHLPFKHQIGQILVEKHPLIKTVVNKTGEIASEFRVLPMELIYGEVPVSCSS